MGKLRRKPCDGTFCRDSAFFKPGRAPGGDDPFFALGTHSNDVPSLQTQEAPGTAEEENKNPLVEGLKTTAGKLADHEPLKKAAEPMLGKLKLTLWDNLSVTDKVAMASFLGIDLGLFGAAWATNPELRKTLSGVNIGKPLGMIPYSPVEGFSYKLPDPGKSALGLSADFTLNPYLGLLHKRYPAFPLTGATFGLESSVDPSGKPFDLTGGKFALDFFGGSLKAEGRTFRELGAYPRWEPGRDPGDPMTRVMAESPGLPPLKQSGAQFMLNADLMKLVPWFRKNLWAVDRR